MRPSILVSLACAAGTLLFACGNRAEPVTPPAPSSTSAPAASAEPAPSAEPAASAAAPARRRKPFEIHSTCAEVVTLVFGEDPSAPGAGRRTVAENSTIEGPRDDEGNMRVHLLDAKGKPIATVKVTRGIKKVEIGRSCATLDAS
jgi:hypothetical protein